MRLRRRRGRRLSGWFAFTRRRIDCERGGFSFGGSGFFSFGTMVTVSCLSFFPNSPSLAAKNTNAPTSAAWTKVEIVKFTFDEFFFFLCTINDSYLEPPSGNASVARFTFPRLDLSS